MMPDAIMHTPREVEIALTARCNLRCRYCCFYDNPAVVYRDLPTAEWLRFFDELGTLGVMRAILSGGEVLLRPDIRELIGGLVRNRMRFHLLSNGARLDDPMAAFLAGTGRCDGVQISLDGGTAQVHDTCRGEGSFEGAVCGIRTLQRRGVPVTVRVTIHRHNVRHLAETARFLLEELGLKSFSTNAAGYLGSCRLHTDEVLLTTAERQLAMETLLELAEKTYLGRIAALAGPLAEGRMWQRMERSRAEGAPAFPEGGRLTGCGCPTHKIAVLADGAIVPCVMLAHMTLGHINHDSLGEIWRASPALAALRARRSVPLAGLAFCAGCDYGPYCTGSCPGLAYSRVGVVDHPDPDACLRGFLADGGHLPGETRQAIGGTG